MSLPGADHAIIEPRKLRDYLLSPSHPIGRYKARFFAGLGFTQSGWADLASVLQRIATEGEIEGSESTAYGVKHEISGMLRGPSGGQAMVVTVWITLVGEEVPRFVTAYPESS
jgi:hypothetical protein